MGKAPAIVIVTRHGARLDAEDKHWSSNSPTPYDTPLSYGGWTQTRALGARVASFLHARESPSRFDNDVTSSSVEGVTTQNASTRHRRHRVIVHSSPFLRCIQSSIAICTGMAQYDGNEPQTQATLPSSGRTRSSSLFARPERWHPPDPKTPQATVPAPATKESMSPQINSSAPALPNFKKPTLCIDACLGEWLTPDYYEFVTAPPSSNMMVAGAKAELLKCPEPLQGARVVDKEGRSVVIAGAGDDRSTMSLERLAQALPGQGTLTGGGRSQDNDRKIGNSGSDFSHTRSRAQGYTPPTPMYALSASEPIPMGYVDHAREACVSVDFQWDSMRPPQDWGDGGTYGEEWSSMHRRFRRALSNMVAWYKSRDSDHRSEHDGAAPEEDGLDGDDETVLIVVTHGAGCNALIGALTNQPVLMDVGMASLTVAMRRDEELSAPSSPEGYPLFKPLSFRRGSMTADNRLPEEYELKLVASTEHLRAGPDPLKIPQLQSPQATPLVTDAGRRQSLVDSGRVSNFANGGTNASRNSSLGSMRRTSVKSAFSSTYNSSPLATSPTTSSGLWGDESASEEGPPKPGLDGTTNGHQRREETPAVRKVTFASPSGRSQATSSPPKPAPGLWGTSVKTETKRRWTVGERR